MTGLELYLALKQNVDAAFTGSISPPKANRFLLQAMDEVGDTIYRNRLKNQEAFDKIARLIITKAAFAPQNNKVFIRPIKATVVSQVGTSLIMTTEVPHLIPSGLSGAGFSATVYGVEDLAAPGITPPSTVTNGITFSIGTTLAVTNSTTLTFTLSLPPTSLPVDGAIYIIPRNTLGAYALRDYRHLLRVATRVKYPSGVTIISATNATPIVIETSRHTKLRDGSFLYFESSVGNTALDGRRYLKQISSKKYEVYSNRALTTPVAGNGVFVSTIPWLYSEKEIKQKVSDEKYSTIAKEDAQDPYWEFNNNSLDILLPQTASCEVLEMDYIRKYPQAIDFTNDIDDLEIWYPQAFLYEVMLRVSGFYGEAYREVDIINITDKQTSQSV